jgi:mono/diheme cytochrome c family protein
MCLTHGSPVPRQFDPEQFAQSNSVRILERGSTLGEPQMTVVKALLSALCVAIAAFSAPATTLAQDVPEDILLAGKADFMTYCATCHGRDGKGNGPVAKHLVTTPADLTMLNRNNGGAFPELNMHQIIDGRQDVMGHGTRDMPIWGNWFKFVARAVDPAINDEEVSEVIVALRIQGLLEYIKTIQEK